MQILTHGDENTLYIFKYTLRTDICTTDCHESINLDTWSFSQIKDFLRVETAVLVF